MPTLPLFESTADLSHILPAFLLRCFVAALCGGIIGIERELKKKPAGFRTNILICLGSTIYMAIGILVPTPNIDPTRIAAQVVTGIGFLGAGCIIQSGHHVRGLTSAATIWVVAAIGIVCGAGFPILAIVSSIIVVVTLAALQHVEKRFFAEQQLDEYTLGDDDSRP
jgi:putative Mg2+ transporter-C (MgtC) family protein